MDLRTPAPRPRRSFRDFVRSIAREHALCVSHDEAGPLKSWWEHACGSETGIRLYVRCDSCGGWSHNLSAADAAELRGGAA